MNYLLFFSIIILLVIDYLFIAKGVLMTPSIIVLLSFAFSSGFFTFNNYIFEKEIGLRTYFTIIFALILWIIGEIFAKHTSFRRDRLSVSSSKNDVLILTSKPVIVIAFIVSMIVLVKKYLTMYQVSLIGGNPNDYIRAFGYARTYMAKHPDITLDVGIFFTQLSVFSKCITYYFLYAFFNNLFKFKQVNISYIIVTLPYLLQNLCDTSRSTIMGSIIIIVIIAFIVDYSKNDWRTVHNRIIICWSFIAIFFIITLFSFLAYLTFRDGRDTWSTIVIYIGSPIYGLDTYLHQTKTANEIFGQETLYYFYKFTNTLKFTNIPNYSWHHSFYYFNGNQSNIYTGLRRSIQDFGVMGMFFFRFILGTVYMWGVKYIKRIANNGIKSMMPIVFISILYEPLVMMSIKDDYPSILSASTLYLLLHLTIIVKLHLFKESNNKSINLRKLTY